MPPVREVINNAYTAGLIDGEGTVSLMYKFKTSPYRWPTVYVPSCTPELILFLKTTFGGIVSNKKARKKHHSPSQTWRVTGNRALNVMQRILPFLQEPEKIRRTKLILDNYKRLTPRNGYYTEEQRVAKLAFEHQFFEKTLRPSRQTKRIRWATIQRH